MNEVEIGRYIGETFAGVDVVTVEAGDSFFFYNPDDSVPPDHRFPIITLVTGDRYDRFSDLDRPGVFRLNIGCVLNPSDETFTRDVQPLLAEAYTLAVGKHKQ